MRRTTAAAPTGLLKRTGPFEPLLTALLGIALDIRTWPRYSRARGTGRFRRLALWPLVLFPSLVARGAGMLGGYAAMLMPERARRWAEAQ